MRRGRKQSGLVMILALLFLGLFASLAVAYASFTTGSLTRARNQAQQLDARLQAEGGLDFVAVKLLAITPPNGTTEQMLESLRAQLQTALAGSLVAPDDQLQIVNGVLEIPPIRADGSGGQFGAELWFESPMSLRLRARGAAGTAVRAVSVAFAPAPGQSGIFDYGIATRSAVRLTGNARVRGANSASEASILSATSATNETFRLTGNCDIDGDLFMTNPDGYASLTGNVTVGGVSASDPAIAEHIHIGVPDAPFPEVDPSVFAPFATCLVDSGTSTSGNKTFNNIRIKAGTNPTFSGNIQLNGVIFIETPNRVHFSGNVTLKGVIVTEDAGDDVYDTNTIKFTGNMTARGVEELPDTPEFHDLRQMPGSFLLAPGFGVEFTGNFGTVGGTMAADSYKFTGNAGGIVKGSVICYSDSDFKLTGNSSLTIDRSGNPETPPGFSLPPTFTMTVSTYQEY